MRVEKTHMQTLASQLSSTLMQLLFSFDRDMRVEKTLMQTLASQLSSTLVKLMFSFDRGMRVEKTLMQTLASQLSSTLMQPLFSFDRGMRVEKTHMQTLASQLSCNSCSRLTGASYSSENSHANSRFSTLMQLMFSIDWGLIHAVEKTLMQILASQLSCNLCPHLIRAIPIERLVITRLYLVQSQGR